MGSHASEKRHIHGSFALSVLSKDSAEINIAHFGVDGLSQWFIRSKITRKCNIKHKEGYYLVQKLLTRVNAPNCITLIVWSRQCYILANLFYHQSFLYCRAHPASVNACCDNFSRSQKMFWMKRKQIINKVPHHKCGHSNIYDVNILFEGNKDWNNDCREYLTDLLDTCVSCHEASLPTKVGAVSFNHFSRGLNQLFFVYFFQLNGLPVFHCMDSVLCYSDAVVADNLSRREAVAGFERNWVSSFWIPQSLQADGSFLTVVFECSLKYIGCKLRASPLYRHNSGAVEPKHRSIRNLSQPLFSENQKVSQNLLAFKAGWISNDLYGNDVASALELPNGYTCPIDGKLPISLPNAVS